MSIPYINQENNWRFRYLKMCVKPAKWMLFGFLLLCDRECLERHYLRCSRCSFISRCTTKIVWLCWLCKYRSVSISALFQFSLLLLYAVSLKVDLPKKKFHQAHLRHVPATRADRSHSRQCLWFHQGGTFQKHPRSISPLSCGSASLCFMKAASCCTKKIESDRKSDARTA